MKKEIEIYIHIPFCEKKCLYCDFVSGTSRKEDRERFVDALIKEIQREEEAKKYLVSTIYFGGGTPSVLETSQIDRILRVIKEEFLVKSDAEITIEVNPGTNKPCMFNEYVKSGINRVSIGLQSTIDEELRTLGRIHTYEEFLKTYNEARSAGINNISIDLMSAIPNQTVKSYRTSLKRIIKLNPEHVSSYSLIIEEGTNFFLNYGPNGKQKEKLPSVEDGEEMYKDTVNLLKEAGYEHYEISNYGKKGYESKHNTGYWKRTFYRGFGPSAASLIENKRFTNEASREKYIEKINNNESVKSDIEVLSREDEISETMFLGLRMKEGVLKDEFIKRFNCDYEDIYKDVLDKYEKTGFIKRSKSGVYITEKGIRVSNTIMADFII